MQTLIELMGEIKIHDWHKFAYSVFMKSVSKYVLREGIIFDSIKSEQKLKSIKKSYDFYTSNKKSFVGCSGRLFSLSI